jgi:hypothetical protein
LARHNVSEEGPAPCTAAAADVAPCDLAKIAVAISLSAVHGAPEEEERRREMAIPSTMARSVPWGLQRSACMAAVLGTAYHRAAVSFAAGGDGVVAVVAVLVGAADPAHE